MSNENKSRVQLMNDLFNEPSENTRSSRQVQPTAQRRTTSSSTSHSSQTRTTEESRRISSVREQPARTVSSASTAKEQQTRTTSSASTTAKEQQTRTTSSASTTAKEQQARTASSTGRVHSTAQHIDKNSEESRSRARQVSPIESHSTTRSHSDSARRTSSQASKTSGNVRTTSPNRTYSDIVEERKLNNKSNGSSSSKKKRKKKSTKKSNGFKKFLIIYAAVWLVIIIVGTIILNSFLTAYEAAQPTVTVTEFVKDFSNTDTLEKFIEENASNFIIPAGILDYKSTVIDTVSGKTIAFIQNEDYLPSAPSYNITADGKTIAVVTLKASDKGSFGLTKWEIGGIDITKCFGTAKTYSILAPENSKVYLNGTELDDSYITGTGVPADLENSVQYMSKTPEFVTYQVSTVTDDIQITGKDSTGADLVFSSNENSYVAGGKATDEFISSVNTIVEDALKEWATYFIYMSFNLEPYILDGSELHAYIFGSDTMDPINPWLYNWEYIDSYTFSVFEVSNYIKYADDCFTVDVKYHLDMTFTDSSMSDDNQELDATWVWVPDGDSWSICDSINH